MVDSQDREPHPLEKYLEETKKELPDIPLHRDRHDNLTQEERRALRELQQNTLCYVCT